jgi:chitodextrinase
MIIIANNREINVSSVLSTTIRRNGKDYPALKFIFDGEITAEDIAALTAGDISIDGNTHEGYTTLGEIAVCVGKITTAEEERDSLESELTTARAEHAEMKENVNIILPKLDDETALSVKSLFPVWQVYKAYAVGDRIVYNDNLYKVVQAHTAQADWTPDSVPSLYDAIKLNDSGYDVWSQPTGAHDAYNTGDIVEYNGTLYKSLIDGNTYAPDAYPAGWEVYTA